MKKTFPLHEPGKADARVIDGIKYDVRKYVKRERRKTLPEGFSQWDFNCRVGANAATAEARTIDDVAGAIDAVAATGALAVYIEILAAAGHRTPRVVAPGIAASPPPAATEPAADSAPPPPEPGAAQSS
ncbi:MAG: DUF6172 family protein [Verrucomicrobia bacterium]|nr:DUF6172 family protein [Verrucomicrobiota bacterium]